jgi:hypothetical protein
MYAFLHALLADRKDDKIFTCFGGFHIALIAITLMVFVGKILYLRSKPDMVRRKITKWFISLAFGLYMLDFFLMPLAYGYIDIEKLPFHACTAMCLLCFLSYHNTFLEKFRTSFALLGLISNLVYLLYPAGVMWHQVHPVTYRVLQTLVFHSVMTVYGFLVLLYENPADFKRCHRDLAVVITMTLWAMIGNYVYNGEAEGYSHFFNWFFVVRDPFYIIPESIAPWIMPILNIGIFFGAEMLFYLLVRLVKNRLRRYSHEENN